MQGYCITPGVCKTFAVLLQDFGSPLRSSADTAFLNDLAAWLTLGGNGNDGGHAYVPGFIWNGYNNATLGEQQGQGVGSRDCLVASSSRDLAVA